MERNLLSNKHGLSAIVITVILIALSMAAIIVVWVFVNNMIKKQISSSESCFGNFDKIKLNQQYTCYDNTAKAVRFSLVIGNIEVDKVIVSVSSASVVKSYELSSTASTELTLYPSGSAVLPGKNSGLTYVSAANSFPSPIDLIQISPVIGGTQCEVSDSISEIEVCT